MEGIICLVFREEPYQSSYQGPMVRSDWLDEQNLSIPQNIDEWDNLLQVFKEAYDAEFTFQTGWRMSPGLAGAFGAHGSFEPRYFIDQSNNVQLAQTQKEWVDYISWLHDLYKDGLIDRDFSTIDDQGVRTKASQDKIGITVMNASTLSGMNLDAQMNGSSAQWVGIPYPNQSDGTKSASIFTEDLYNAQELQFQRLFLRENWTKHSDSSIGPILRKAITTGILERKERLGSLLMVNRFILN